MGNCISISGRPQPGGAVSAGAEPTLTAPVGPVATPQATAHPAAGLPRPGDRAIPGAGARDAVRAESSTGRSDEADVAVTSDVVASFDYPRLPDDLKRVVVSTLDVPTLLDLRLTDRANAAIAGEVVAGRITVRLHNADDLPQALQRFPNLERLVIEHDANCLGSHLTHLRGCTALRELEVRYATNLQDDDLAPLAELVGLERLLLRGMHQVDGGLAHISKLTALTDLEITGAYRLSDASVASLAGCARLERLSLCWAPSLTNAALPPLSALTGLRELALLDMHITALPVLRQFTKLERLDMGRGYLDDHGLRQLCRDAPESLRSLNFSGNNFEFTDAGFAELGRLTQLQSLGADGLSEGDIGVLAPLTGLRELDLRCCGPEFGDNALTTIGTLTELRSLTVPITNQLTDAGLSHLQSLDHLECLDLSGSFRIECDGLRFLSGMTRLRDLDLRYMGRLQDRSMEIVAAFPALRTLDLTSSGDQFSDRALEHLHAAAGLQTLKLDCNRFSPEAIQALLDSLPQLTINGGRQLRHDSDGILQIAPV